MFSNDWYVFMTTDAVKQGASLSQLLFTLFMDEIIKMLKKE